MTTSHSRVCRHVVLLATIIAAVSALTSPLVNILSPSRIAAARSDVSFVKSPQPFGVANRNAATRKNSGLHMSDGGDSGMQRQRKKKKGVTTITKERTASKVEQKKKDETLWRVLLHNDEVHTFQYVTQSLIKVIGTLDKKSSFEICVTVHTGGIGTVTTTWKQQAEKFCMGLQRQGLTVSIAPDKKFVQGKSDFSDYED